MNLPVVITALGQDVTESSAPEQLVGWFMDKFGHQRILLSTSFGMEGCALIDMFARTEIPMTVVYLDTMFFFPETYALRDRMVQRYPHITFENRGTTMTPEQQAATHGPELWKSNPDLCCQIRKVEPMNEIMKGIDVWVTALRRSQSKTRANLKVLEWDWKFRVLKFSPFAGWSRQQVWEHIQTNDVPYNELHERDYPTVGCTHCTSPVAGSKIGDYSREGRWEGLEKKECGLHGDGI